MADSEHSKIRDIAAAANVSTATVSRVFNRHPYVSDEIRGRVLELARKMNYAPGFSSSKHIFGIMESSGVGFNFGPYFSQVVSHTSKYFFDKGFNVQLFSSKQLEYIHRNTFRGVILLSKAHVECFRKLDIPFVLVNHIEENAYSVITDHREGIEMAVAHLVKKGHEKIAFISCSQQNWGSIHREEGYHSGLAKAGIRFRSEFLSRITGIKDFPSVIRRIMKHSPTAMIMDGESFALPVYHALVKQGYRIPDDVSLITFEDPAVSSFTIPELTSISQDFKNLGTTAANLLIQISSGRKKLPPPGLTVLHNKLIERLSVKKI